MSPNQPLPFLRLTAPLLLKFKPLFIVVLVPFPLPDPLLFLMVLPVPLSLLDPLLLLRSLLPVKLLLLKLWLPLPLMLLNLPLLLLLPPPLLPPLARLLLMLQVFPTTSANKWQKHRSEDDPMSEAAESDLTSITSPSPKCSKRSKHLEEKAEQEPKSKPTKLKPAKELKASVKKSSRKKY